jgi:hypothetical protein
MRGVSYDINGGPDRAQLGADNDGGAFPQMLVRKRQPALVSFARLPVCFVWGIPTERYRGMIMTPPPAARC